MTIIVGSRAYFESTSKSRPSISVQFQTILGIRFLQAPAADAIARLRDGGLMIVPSAPVLATLPHDHDYRAAALACDFALVDSAFMTLLWYVAKRERLLRVSGLEFLRRFLHEPSVREPGALFLVDPSELDSRANRAWLRDRGIMVSDEHCYLAPNYSKGRIVDQALLGAIEARRPRFVIINVGGGVQEPLGLYLKQNLSYSPGIICTGAAIAFLTGRQARIPDWADRSGLGWLLRCVRDPRRFVKRYVKALALAPLIFAHGTEMPPLTR